jgi:soluble lytic murein transglycosylase-like protein
MTRLPAVATLVLALGCAQAARADIYAYTDEAGVTHFSNVPNDNRYQLLIAAPRDPAAVGRRAPAAHSAAEWLAQSAKYDALIDRAAIADTVQAALVRAVIVVESGFNPKAVSKKGAVGLMQLQAATAKRYGVKNRFDPDQNVRAGVHYLRDLLARYDSNIELALAAYNAGEDAVERYGRRIPPFPETLNYVPSVMAVYQKLLAFSSGKRST